MKYSRLTKKQFQELSNEFALYLASNSIDSVQWKNIKLKSIDKAEKILDLFSDIVWDRVISRVNYLINTDKTHLFLFKCHNNSIKSIIVKSNDKLIDLKNEKSHSFILNNINSNKIEIFRSEKKLNKTELNKEIHNLIVRGADVSKGELFDMYDKRLS